MIKFQSRSRAFTFSTVVVLAASTLNAQTVADRSRIRETTRTVARTAVKTKMSAPTRITWTNVRISEALSRLRASLGILVFLDRRVDPTTRVSFVSGDATLEIALRQMAESNNLGLSVLESMAYLGPKSTARKLATVLSLKQDLINRLSRDQRKNWVQRQPMAWPLLSEPRQLVRELLADNEVRCTGGLQMISHDLWAANELPASNLAERLTILLAGFDLTFDITQSGNCRITAIPDRVFLRRSYAIPESDAGQVERLKTRMPSARFKSNGRMWTVEATYEEHQRISATLHGAGTTSTARSDFGEKRYSLTVKNQPFDRIIRALAKQLKLQLELDPSVAEINQPISFSVQNATLKELLDAATQKVPVRYQLTGELLRIHNSN